MPWEIWKRPGPGEKVHYWQRPSLEVVDESSPTFTYTTTLTSTDWKMTNVQEGGNWGSGGATTSFNTDEWNSGSAGANGWNDGSATNSFNTGGGAAAGGFEGSGEGAGPSNLSGACFNCGQEGHMKSGMSSPDIACHKLTSAECTNPRVERAFDGTCRTCDQQGN